MTARQGRVAWEGPVASKILGSNRFIRIYLPPSYETDRCGRFPVLYVHDGQNAFTTAGDHVAFGWGNWRLDRTVDELVAAGRMRPILMVAVDASAQRYLEYRGPAARSVREKTSVSIASNGRFERYGRFLVEELKPRMDAEYRTRPEAEETGVMGSSMGGLCSLALAWKFPRVFGCAASLSGAFQVERGTFLRQTLRRRRSRPQLRLYLDSGVVDRDGSDDGRKQTMAVVQKLRDLGWRDGVDLTSYTEEHLLTESELARLEVDPAKWREAGSSQHNELYWRLRASRPLTVLFPPERRKVL